MAVFSEDKVQMIWDSAIEVTGCNSNEWRKDPCGAWINRKEYGLQTEYGWDVDHILPISKNGTDHTSNLRALHWKNNKSKGDDFPVYTLAVTSHGNINVEQQEKTSIHPLSIRHLQMLYPDNNHLRVRVYIESKQ